MQGLLMLHTYILIIFLTGGGVRVTVQPNFWACVVQSQFELRFDPGISTISCVPHEGDEA